MGGPDGELWVDLVWDEIEVGAIYRWLLRDDCGAVVVFSGTVRSHSEGRSGVTKLEYEAYLEPAKSQMMQICLGIRSNFEEIGRVCMIHRLGAMTPTESTVVVGVSAAHRTAAFDAARFGIDELKAKVPVWKKEFFEGGSEWGLGATQLGAPLAPPHF